MGAISASRSVPILKEYLSDPERTVRETCEIAIAKIQWDHSEEGKNHLESLKGNPTPYVTFRSTDKMLISLADSTPPSTPPPQHRDFSRERPSLMICQRPKFRFFNPGY